MSRFELFRTKGRFMISGLLVFLQLFVAIQANAAGGQCVKSSEYNIGSSDKGACKMNGSCLKNGHIVRPNGKLNECRGLDGDLSANGAGGCLTAFFSVAADLRHYRVGDIIYMPDIYEGDLTVPSGKRHPGFFIVQDTGGAIKGAGRFDFYTGTAGLNDSRNIFGGAGRKFSIMKDKAKCKLPFYVIRRGRSATVPGWGNVSYAKALSELQKAASPGKEKQIELAESEESPTST